MAGSVAETDVGRAIDGLHVWLNLRHLGKESETYRSWYSTGRITYMYILSVRVAALGDYLVHNHISVINKLYQVVF